MAKKDDDEETLDLKEIVKVAKLRPMNFALAPGKSTPIVLIAHKQLDPSRLAEKAKRQGIETSKLVYGVMRVEGMKLRLDTNGKVQPQLLRAFKQQLQAQKIQLKPYAPGSEDEDDDSELIEALKKTTEEASKCTADVAKIVAEAAKKAAAAAKGAAAGGSAGGGAGDGNALAPAADAAKQVAEATEKSAKLIAALVKKIAAETDAKRAAKLAEEVKNQVKQSDKLLADPKLQDLERERVVPSGMFSKAATALDDVLKRL